MASSQELIRKLSDLGASNPTGEPCDWAEQLFAVADADGSGSIQFGEFLAYHQTIMRLASAAVESALGTEPYPKLQYRETEHCFRQLDSNGDQQLDRLEFQAYMTGVLTALGAGRYQEVCEALLQKERERRAFLRDGFDRRASERLLDQARAAHRYHPAMVEAALRFLEEKADPNYVDCTGSNALLYVADKADSVLVRHLLRARADPMHHNAELECAAIMAARVHSLDVVEALLLPDQDGTQSPERERVEALGRELVRSMALHTGAEVRDFVGQRADINFRNENGWTPLTAAVFWGKHDCVEALLKSQPSTVGKLRLRLDGRNCKGRTALHIAARKGQGALVSLLLVAKSDPDTQDYDGWTSLHHAAFNGQSVAVQALVEGCASVLVQGRNGMTPWMITKLPTHAGTLSEAATKLLEPSENVDYGKAIVPILKDTERSLYSKLEALSGLPGVRQNLQNLRLAEQLFDPRHGPNKARLLKLWETLALPMIRRLRSGEADQTDPELGPEDKALEAARRQREQRFFVRQWLLDTMGPRPGPDWDHENRAAYGEQLRAVVAEELEAFGVELEGRYEGLLEGPAMAELAALPAEEVLDTALLCQLGAHPIPLWVEQLDPAGALEALRLVGAPGMGRDDDASLMAFTELIIVNPDFDSGRAFWQNIYRFWLSLYAKMADMDFQRKVRGIVDAFNEVHGESLGVATFRAAPVKTYERIKAKEASLGQAASYETYEGRTRAARVLDVIRSSITVSSPEGMVVLLKEYFKPLQTKENLLRLVRLTNRFSSTAETLHGYRSIEMNLLWNGGLRAGLCARPHAHVQIQIIGEVQIVLEDILAIHKRRHLVYKCARGDFDWSQEGRLAAAAGAAGAFLGALDDDGMSPPHS